MRNIYHHKLYASMWYWRGQSMTWIKSGLTLSSIQLGIYFPMWGKKGLQKLLGIFWPCSSLYGVMVSPLLSCSHLAMMAITLYFCYAQGAVIKYKQHVIFSTRLSQWKPEHWNLALETTVTSKILKEKKCKDDPFSLFILNSCFFSKCFPWNI